MSTCAFEQNGLHFRLTVRIENVSTCPVSREAAHDEAEQVRNYAVPYHLNIAVYDHDPEQTGDWRAVYVGQSPQETLRAEILCGEVDHEELLQQISDARKNLISVALDQVRCLKPIREREVRAHRLLTDALSKAGA